MIFTAEASTISDHMTSSSTGSSAASFIYLFLNLFTWVCLVLVVACEIFDLACRMQDLFFFFSVPAYKLLVAAGRI